jgi:hypothetical protein
VWLTQLPAKFDQLDEFKFQPTLSPQAHWLPNTQKGYFKVPSLPLISHLSLDSQYCLSGSSGPLGVKTLKKFYSLQAHFCTRLPRSVTSLIPRIDLSFLASIIFYSGKAWWCLIHPTPKYQLLLHTTLGWTSNHRGHVHLVWRRFLLNVQTIVHMNVRMTYGIMPLYSVHGSLRNVRNKISG